MEYVQHLERMIHLSDCIYDQAFALLQQASVMEKRMLENVLREQRRTQRGLKDLRDNLPDNRKTLQIAEPKNILNGTGF